MSMLGPRGSVRGRVLLLPRERGGRAARVRFLGGGGSIGEEGKEVIWRAWGNRRHVADRIFAGHARRPSTPRDNERHQEGPRAFLPVVSFGVCLCQRPSSPDARRHKGCRRNFHQIARLPARLPDFQLHILRKLGPRSDGRICGQVWPEVSYYPLAPPCTIAAILQHERST